MTLRSAAALIVLFATGLVTASDSSLPPAGSYGFNWLDPASECREITAADIAKFKHCEASTNAIGQDLPAHACKVDADTEIMVYASAAQCQEALETMQANDS